jgi:undecaprenyl-diphosphatase
VILVLALVAVAEDVLKAEHDELVLRLDARILAALVEPPAPVRRAAAILSHLTGEGLFLGTLAAVAALAAWRRRRDAIVLAGSALGAWGASGVFKGLFLVPRPRAHGMLRVVASYGFPSGHTLVTLVTCGTLAWLLAARAAPRTRHLLMTGAWVLAIVGGASRVILRAHWPSDVAAALALGALWLLVLPVVVGAPGPPAEGGVLGAATPPR